MIIRDEKGRVTFGRWEIAIQVLIILSLIDFAVETMPNLPDEWHQRLRYFEIFCVCVFSAEYLVRLFLSRPPTAYAFSFLGLIDLIAILPFFLFAGLDLRSTRAFRLLRLLRIFKFARYSVSARRFHRAFVIVKDDLMLFGFTSLILLYLSAVGIYYFENVAQPENFASVFDSMWWAIVTLTTVGYGDIYPVTIGGRIFTFFILVLGLGTVAIPSGLFAAALSRARDEIKDADESDQ